MSTTKTVTCDGCGHTAASPYSLYPYGWLRLNVTGRKLGEPRSTGLATVDICQTKCAEKALLDPFLAVAKPE